jgi:hypothetical protein
MSRFFVRPMDESERARGRARQLLQFGMRSRPQLGGWGRITGYLSAHLDSHPDAILAHDEMGEQYRPVYFHQFMEQAGRHGLQYLAEGDYTEMDDSWLTPEELEPLAHLEGDPLLLREQYMDFLKCRAFRQTLLCHRDVTLRRDARAKSVLKLLVSSRLRPVAERPDLDGPTPEQFRTPEGTAITMPVPAAKRLLVRLAQQWPEPLPVSDLISPDAPAATVGDFLLQLYAAGLADLQSHRLSYVIRPGQRPEVSLLARLQLERHSLVTNRKHENVEVKDTILKALLQRADGTRDRAALLAELRAVDPAATPELLESTLNELGKLALLTA